MKLWSGRFEKQSDKLADKFNASLSFDIKLYKHDIAGSIAHCNMLAKCNIIEPNEAEIIINELKNIEKEISIGTLQPNDAEDVHMFVEGELIKRLGDTGKRLHTARSRNDQVATDFRMYLRDSIDTNIQLLSSLTKTLNDIACQNLATFMPGFTHLQAAQPVTLAHHLTAYCEMFIRDIERFTDTRKRTNRLPLGSCALAGTTYPIDRYMVAQSLGFEDICHNSMDAVSDRDFALEYLFCCATTSMHLSRFCEEIIVWNSQQFAFIEIDDAYATGSSIMPQKKNPDMAELIRGKSGRMYGNLMSLLTVLKALPLAYNKDMQEDKECVFDSETTLQNCIKILTAMMPKITFKKSELQKAATKGFTSATDIADYLVKKGMPFREAHEVSGSIVLYCIKNNTKIESLSIEIFKSFSKLFSEDILHAVKLKNVVNNRKSAGGTAAAEVKKNIKRISNFIDSL